MLDVVPPSTRTADLKWYRANLFKVGIMSMEWTRQYKLRKKSVKASTKKVTQLVNANAMMAQLLRIQVVPAMDEEYKEISLSPGGSIGLNLN